MGKSKLVRNNDSILISYSGGPSSCALLDLIKNSIDGDTRREQKFRPSILYIDMQSILHPTSGLAEFQMERRAHLLNILNNLRETHPSWPVYWTSIETATVTESNRITFARYIEPSDFDTYASTLLSSEEAHLSLQQSIADSGDLTARHQYVIDTCSTLIPRVANDINKSIDKQEDKFKYVFTGSTSTQLANNLMVDVILGRGETIRPAVNICDNRYQVPIMRPLRDFSKKEIAYYLLARNMEPIIQPDMLTKADQKSSIQTVTESFLTKLYVDYPSTYSTLLKTGNKLL